MAKFFALPFSAVTAREISIWLQITAYIIEQWEAALLNITDLDIWVNNSEEAVNGGKCRSNLLWEHLEGFICVCVCVFGSINVHLIRTEVQMLSICFQLIVAKQHLNYKLHIHLRTLFFICSISSMNQLIKIIMWKWMNKMLILQNYCTYLNYPCHYLEDGEVNLKKHFKMIHIYWHPSVWKKENKT